MRLPDSDRGKWVRPDDSEHGANVVRLRGVIRVDDDMAGGVVEPAGSEEEDPVNGVGDPVEDVAGCCVEAGFTNARRGILRFPLDIALNSPKTPCNAAVLTQAHKHATHSCYLIRRKGDNY